MFSIFAPASNGETRVYTHLGLDTEPQYRLTKVAQVILYSSRLREIGRGLSYDRSVRDVTCTSSMAYSRVDAACHVLPKDRDHEHVIENRRVLRPGLLC